jgi:hypothetical protein
LSVTVSDQGRSQGISLCLLDITTLDVYEIPIQVVKQS